MRGRVDREGRGTVPSLSVARLGPTLAPFHAGSARFIPARRFKYNIKTALLVGPGGWGVAAPRGPPGGDTAARIDQNEKVATISLRASGDM